MHKSSTFLLLKNPQISLPSHFLAFSDFFSGWMTVMPALGKGVAQQEEAKNVYQTTFENLFNVTSIKESEEK